MSEKVWIRDYAEKSGASVDWDPVHNRVLIDGTHGIHVDEIRDGKGYIDKRVIDAFLKNLGHEPPDETPSTSSPSQEMEQEEKRREYYTTLPSRGYPTWGEISGYVDTRIIEPLRSWIVEHVWKPVLNWVKPFYESLRTLGSTFANLWNSIWEFTEKIKYAIKDYANTAKQTVVEWASPTIEWFKDKMGYLEWVIHHEVLDSLNYLVNQRNKFIYVFTVAFDRLFAILEAPVHFIADAVVSGFEFWSEKIFGMVEDYVVVHWEDRD